jgi:hypothetical protein
VTTHAEREAGILEARLRHEMYVGIAECGCRAKGYSCVKCDARVDAAFAAVRATERERVVASVVAKADKLRPDAHQRSDLWYDGYDSALDDLLTALRGLAPHHTENG